MNDVILTSYCDVIDSDWVVRCVISLDIFQANLKACAGNILKLNEMIVVVKLLPKLSNPELCISPYFCCLKYLQLCGLSKFINVTKHLANQQLHRDSHTIK